jgi:Large polyvalent protein associated domain 23
MAEALIPVDHQPEFDHSLQPVDYDPFAAEKFANPVVAPMINSLATLPQRAIQNSQFALNTGTYDPSVPVEAALTLAGAGAPMAERGAAGIFGGRLAKTADQTALAKAEEMASRGADKTAIWNETGWFQGADSKWRFEIPDTNAKLNPNTFANGLPDKGESGPVAGQLWHKDLYDAYPELRRNEMSVEKSNSVRGHYIGSDGDAFVTVKGPTVDVARSTALHEMQHGVQGMEGFARGGDPSMLKPGTPAWEIYQERLKAIKTPLDRDTYAKVAGYDGPVPEKDYKAYLKIVKKPSPMVDRAAQEYAALSAYKRSAGEVEARNVQTRRDMTPEQRAASPPWETQDIPNDRQIINFGPTNSIRFIPVDHQPEF